MNSHAMLVGVVGVSGSGKTTIANGIVKKLREEKHNVSYIRTDHYYKDDSHMTEEERSKHNFDHPDAMDMDALYQDLQKLLNNQSVDRRIYPYASSPEDDKGPKIAPAPIIVVEGLFLLSDERIRKLFSLLYLVDTPLDCAFARRITRETEQKHDIRRSLYAYETQIRPAAFTYVLNLKKYANDTLSNENPTIRAASIEKACLAIKSKFANTRHQHASMFESTLRYAPALLSLGMFTYQLLKPDTTLTDLPAKLGYSK